VTEPVDPAEPREMHAPVRSRVPRDAWADGQPRRAGDVPDEGAEPGEAESVNVGEEVAPGQPRATSLGLDDVMGGADSVAAQRHPEQVTEAAAGSDLAAERLADLQRLQAEYVNYKRRVDRDRAVVQERAVRDVLESLLPVLDDIHAAREHGDLADGPFAAIADKFETALGRYGLSQFGAVGEGFDPVRHEALMHAPWPEGSAGLPADASMTTVVTVLQPGYRVGDHVLRPARVAVADPP
ncbi:MAG: nucleotide exchange factor GrpE, partial [Phycicoccus sp.]